MYMPHMLRTYAIIIYIDRKTRTTKKMIKFFINKFINYEREKNEMKIECGDFVGAFFLNVNRSNVVVVVNLVVGIVIAYGDRCQVVRCMKRFILFDVSMDFFDFSQCIECVAQ